MNMKSIAILGSTGSVGVTTLDVVGRFPERFRVAAMAAGRNVDLLAEQIRRFEPELVSVASPVLARELAERVRPLVPTILHGGEGTIAVATHPATKLVMSALVGALGLRPTLAAIRAGKDIAFANKEVLVIAGELVTRAVRDHGVRLLPVDSEHNAIFQCLEGKPRSRPETYHSDRFGRTLSPVAGRAFSVDHDQGRAQPSDLADGQQDHDRFGDPDEQGPRSNRGALAVRSQSRGNLRRHPSAERNSFYGRDDRRFRDRRRWPCPTWRSRWPLRWPIPNACRSAICKPLSLVGCGPLTFEEPDIGRFPCLRLAYDALRAGGTMPACLNAANEELVAGFLAGRVAFTEIPRQIEAIMNRHAYGPARTLEDLLETDGWARRTARECIAAAAA